MNKEIKEILWILGKVFFTVVAVIGVTYALEQPGFKETMMSYLSTTLEFIGHVMSFKGTGNV